MFSTVDKFTVGTTLQCKSCLLVGYQKITKDVYIYEYNRTRLLWENTFSIIQGK